MTNKDNFLTSLISAGNDAHGNLYKVEFTGGEFSNEKTGNSMTIRTSGFTPPSITHESYTVHYLTGYIDWPKAKANVTRNFTIDFRVDSNWLVYEALLKQKNKTSKASESYAGTHVTNDQGTADSNTTFTVKVFAIEEGLKETDITTDIDKSKKTRIRQLYEFDGCWITKIDSPNFTQGSSDSIKVQVTINFLQMKDTETGFDDDPDKKS